MFKKLKNRVFGNRQARSRGYRDRAEEVRVKEKRSRFADTKAEAAAVNIKNKFKDDTEDDDYVAYPVPLSDSRLNYNRPGTYSDNLWKRKEDCRNFKIDAEKRLYESVPHFKYLNKRQQNVAIRDEVMRILKEKGIIVLDKNYNRTNEKLTNIKKWNMSCYKAKNDWAKLIAENDEIFNIGSPLRTLQYTTLPRLVRRGSMGMGSRKRRKKKKTRKTKRSRKTKTRRKTKRKSRRRSGKKK